MSLPEIRQALAAIFLATPPVSVNGTTVGLKQSLAYQPQEPPEIVPCAYLGNAAGLIGMSHFEIWQYDLPLHVVVSEAGAGEMERLTVETFLLALVKQLRGHASANNTAAVVSASAFDEEPITIQNKPYRGFTLTLSVEEKYEAASDYGP